MKKEFILQILCVFAVVFAGLANDASGQTCTQSGGVGYNLGEFCTLRVWNLQVQTGSTANYLRGDGSAAVFPTIPSNTNQLINGAGFLTAEVDGSVTNEIELPTQTGNAGRDLITNGTSVSWGKRRETYSGTTSTIGGNAGTYQVTFANAYSVAPNIQANIINGADNQNLRITDISTTGFTVLVRTRTDVVGLLPSWAGANGLAVDVLITEK